MTNYLSGKETAKIIRKQLKQNFPNTKFSVRSDYSSVRVEYFDGPSWDKVNELVRQFQGKHFNGSIDLEENQSTVWEGEEICFNVYTSCYRNLSPLFAQRILDYCQDKYSNHVDLDINAVKLNINTYDNKTYASFDGRGCVETACYTNGSIVHISQEARTISIDDELDWETESQAIALAEKAEIEACQRRIQARLDFIASLDCDLPPLENNEIVINDIPYKFIDYKPVISGDGSSQMPFRLNYWTYQTKNPQGIYYNFSLETVEKALNPIVPIAIDTYNIRTKAKFANLNKNQTLKEYREYCQKPKSADEWYWQPCKITERITLSPQDYDRFTQDLLDDYAWLKGKGGSDSDIEGLPDVDFYELTEQQQERWIAHSYSLCVAVTAQNKETILVDPQGYSYARYVGLVEEDPFKTQLEYKKWLQSLIEQDELSQIVSFEDWQQNISL